MGNEISKKEDASATESKATKVDTKDQESKSSSPSSPQPNKIQSLMKLTRKKPPPIPPFRRRKLSHAFATFFDISGNGCVDWEDFDLARQNVCRLNGWKPDMQVAMDAEETFKNLWQLLQESADENKDGKVTTEEWIQMWEEVSTKVNINQLELELQYEKALVESVAEAAAAEAASTAAAAAALTSPVEEAAPLAAESGDGTANAGRLSISSFTSSPSHIPRYSPSKQRKSIGAKLFNLPGKPIEPNSKLKSIPWLSKFIDYKFSLFDRTRNGIIDIEEFEYVLSDFGITAKEARQAFTLMTLNDTEKLDYYYFKKLLLQFYFSDDECSLGNFVTGKLSFEDDSA